MSYIAANPNYYKNLFFNKWNDEQFIEFYTCFKVETTATIYRKIIQDLGLIDDGSILQFYSDIDDKCQKEILRRQLVNECSKIDDKILVYYKMRSI